MPKRKPIVYIAGPISSAPDIEAARSAFHLAAAVQEELGFEVFNPATLPKGLLEPQYMSICLPMLMCADKLYVLDGYEQSSGALTEIALAKKLDIQITYQEGTDHEVALIGLRGG